MQINQTLQGDKVTIRSISPSDYPILYNLIYGEEEPEWKKWDAPYFPLDRISLEEYSTQMSKRVVPEGEPVPRMIIESDGEIIGSLSYYWEHRPSNWLEIGIVIYNSNYWNGGYGTEALRIWISYLLESLPLVRVGLTTWSGNVRMMRAAEKVGMTLEGRMRKCRLYQGIYYDSIRMGMLREEWDELTVVERSSMS
ncbi:GNAT family N-acetyltransferase [Paenibacillus selenitireducens]|uniref:GNAT family N-acetyltransferase n=1 Tax=Paenibacillus selenitireducens TaxID=1324314 RepID=A0A1T2X1K3_9BACL|nr:GNAT family protein [Paenibacillus selenitireducens]OPA73744.1 GNAT family N-acetyltransferase [Paenibacillus selenitireducens]